VLAPINVNLNITIKFRKREFPSLPWNLGEQKKQAPDFSEAQSLHGARGTSARASISVYIVANIAAVNECRTTASVRTPAWNDDFKEVPTLRGIRETAFRTLWQPV